MLFRRTFKQSRLLNNQKESSLGKRVGLQFRSFKFKPLKGCHLVAPEGAFFVIIFIGISSGPIVLV